MKRLAAAVLALACAAAAPAEVPGDDPMLALVVQARARGCAGHAGTDAPLHGSAALAHAARRIDKGEAPLAAVQAEGYRARRVFHARLAGYRRPEDVAGALAQGSSCAALTDPEFTDFGFARQGTSWLVVLAGRIQLPALADPRAVTAKVLALTNEARAHARRCGDESFDPAPPLRANSRLGQAALLHAQDMAAHGYIAHVARDGSTPAQRISRAGYRWRSIGENVAAGQATPEDVVADWVASPGHCANLMSPDFSEMGIAFAVNMDAKAVVYWAQEFGRPQ